MKIPTLIFLVCGLVAYASAQPPQVGAPTARPLSDVLPLDRTAYFVGETVPLALTGAGELKLEAVNGDGRTTSRRGRVPSGQGLDNAVAESFFGTLKAELLGDQPGRCFESKRQTLELAAFNGLTALV